MKHERNGGKRTNWLLIKHSDKYATDGNGDGIDRVLSLMKESDVILSKRVGYPT